MRPGIAKHMVAPLMPEYLVCQHRLPEAQTAVVGRHQPMLVDNETALGEQVDALLQQKYVLEYAPGQRDCRQTCCLAETLAHRGDNLCHGAVKPRGDLSSRSLGQPLLRDGPEKPACLYHEML